jgi:hypothetical protein
VSSANQRSTRFNQLELVGVKCTWTRGWRSSHFCTASVLWVEELSRTRWMSRSAGTAVLMASRNWMNSLARSLPSIVADNDENANEPTKIPTN